MVRCRYDTVVDHLVTRYAEWGKLSNHRRSSSKPNVVHAITRLTLLDAL